MRVMVTQASDGHRGCRVHRVEPGRPVVSAGDDATLVDSFCNGRLGNLTTAEKIADLTAGASLQVIELDVRDPAVDEVVARAAGDDLPPGRADRLPGRDALVA